MSCELRRARPLLGTLVEVRATTPTLAQAGRAVRAAFAAVERVHQLMSFHEPASDLSLLNQQAARRAVRVHAWTWRVLCRAQKLHAASGGLFDIAVAPALVRHGWLPRNTAARPAVAGTTADMMLLAGNRVRFRRPLLLDLGGIAKGFAVDQAVAALRRAGATAGLVNAGGDLRVFGPQSEPIHVRLPELPGALVPLGKVRDGAVATSAHYFAQRRVGGKARAPIFHPHRRAFAGEARSVTVFARECWLADALCKVAWLAGADAYPLLQKFAARARVLEAPARLAGKEARRHAA
jgi:thiamine biosynthesis lipoprotein